MRVDTHMSLERSWFSSLRVTRGCADVVGGIQHRLLVSRRHAVGRGIFFIRDTTYLLVLRDVLLLLVWGPALDRKSVG